MNKYVATIPMQNSILQTTTFILFTLSLFCLNSMLPCGRYYYEPEGGYVRFAGGWHADCMEKEQPEQGDHSHF